MKLLLTIAVSSLLSLCAHADSKCTYRFGLAKVIAKKPIPANQKIEVNANLKCNTVKAYDIEAIANTGPKGIEAGGEIPFSGKDLEVDVRIDQIDELQKHFPGANLGMDVFVAFKKNPLRRFLESAKTGFLSPSAAGGVVLYETDYGNSKTKDGRKLFDPRLMSISSGASSPMVIENDSIAIHYEVKKSCAGEAPPPANAPGGPSIGPGPGPAPLNGSGAPAQ